MKFGENLKKIRKQSKISQEELALKVGVSRQSVSKWETGEAYPEMNNMLELCKIFHCHINDLVHEDMSDIDSLGEEIKMKVVKFKSEKQKKMKGISKAVYVISRIGKVMMIVGMVGVLIAMFFVPLLIDNVGFTDTQVMIYESVIDVKNNVVDGIRYVFENNSNIQLIIYAEIILVCLGTYLFILNRIFEKLEKLFMNIHDGETPFTLENVGYIKKISKLLIFNIIFMPLSAGIMELVLNVDLNIDVSLMDVVFILITISLSYIFEYGYELQLDSKGVMYDEK